MKSSFEYNKEYIAQKILDIDEIGDCCIEAINENDLLYYYLLIKTSLGTCQVFSYGPVIPDINDVVDSYSFNYNELKYNEKKLITFIVNWLNDKSKKITSANIIKESNFLNNNIDLSEFVKLHIKGE